MSMHVAIISVCIASVYGHGRLIKPVTRSLKKGFPTHKMNAPVGHSDSGFVTSTPTLDSSFVCRGNDEVMDIEATLTPGQPLTMQWQLDADHRGDCAVYISYDTEEQAKDQRFFKIASIPRCREYNGQPFDIQIPEWLPAAKNAILRWGWYALHVHPTIEFYAQCVDVEIVGNTVLDPNNLPSPNYKIPGVFPPTGKGFAYRYAFNPFNKCDENALADYPSVSCQEDGTTGPDMATYEGTPSTPTPTVQGQTPEPTPKPEPTPEPTNRPTSVNKYYANWGYNECVNDGMEQDWSVLHDDIDSCCQAHFLWRKQSCVDNGGHVPGNDTPKPTSQRLTNPPTIDSTPNPTTVSTPNPTKPLTTPNPTTVSVDRFLRYTEFCASLDNSKDCKKPCKWKKNICNPKKQEQVSCKKFPKGNDICKELGCKPKKTGKCGGKPVWEESTPKPTIVKTPKPTKAAKTPKPTDAEINPKPSAAPMTPRPTAAAGDSEDIEGVLAALRDSSSDGVFQYETPTSQWVDSDLYKWDDMIEGVKNMAYTGVGSSKLWVGSGEGVSSAKQVEYGLVNVAAFLAQAMQESIRYNACDENNWSDKNVVNSHGGSTYSATSACGQLHQSYQDYTCTAEEDDMAGGRMACDVDPDMEMKAFTQAKWYGAPPPLFCAPKSKLPKAPRWDSAGPWCAPADGWDYKEKIPAGEFGDYLDYVVAGGSCQDYEGQKAGGWKYDGEGCVDGACPGSDAPLFGVPDGRTDVEGCCWWGRGAIQSTGTCNYGKLSFYLGKKGADMDRDVLYPEIDFCKNPNSICDPTSPPELKWVAGFFYWLNSVQGYSQDGWTYQEKLKEWVDSGKNTADTSFIDGASGIVNRGCHNPPNCGTGDLHAAPERRSNFRSVLQAMKLI